MLKIEGAKEFATAVSEASKRQRKSFPQFISSQAQRLYWDLYRKFRNDGTKTSDIDAAIEKAKAEGSFIKPRDQARKRAEREVARYQSAIDRHINALVRKKTGAAANAAIVENLRRKRNMITAGANLWETKKGFKSFSPKRLRNSAGKQLNTSRLAAAYEIQGRKFAVGATGAQFARAALALKEGRLQFTQKQKVSYIDWQNEGELDVNRMRLVVVHSNEAFSQPRPRQWFTEVLGARTKDIKQHFLKELTDL